MRYAYYTLFLITSFVVFGRINDKKILDLLYPQTITVDNTVLNDSTHVDMTVYNIGNRPIEFRLIPECECTRVYPESIKLKPKHFHEFKISYVVNSLGTYERLIILNRNDKESPDSIVIKGVVKR